jgi:hypothetical protein
MSFKADYQEFLDEVDNDLSKEMEAVLKHGLAFARTTAPVDTGAYRKSIVFSKGSPTGGTISVSVSDPYSKYYIYTDSPYANCIEYGCKGYVPWSDKAPNGVFGITAESMRSRFGLKKT